MLAALAAVAAATGGCPSHSVAAPANATFDTRCAWRTTERASSLFECVEKCAADGGGQRAPTRRPEYAWLAETIFEDFESAWAVPAARRGRARRRLGPLRVGRRRELYQLGAGAQRLVGVGASVVH